MNSKESLNIIIFVSVTIQCWFIELLSHCCKGFDTYMVGGDEGVNVHVSYSHFELSPLIQQDCVAGSGQILRHEYAQALLR